MTLKSNSLAIIILIAFICSTSCNSSHSHEDRQSKLKDDVVRPWIGPEYMTNPLMNWQLNEGRIENTHGGWVNEVHSLTKQLRSGAGTLELRVKLGALGSTDQNYEELAFAGFKIGAVGHRNHYLSNVLHDLQNGFAKHLMKEAPISIGISSEGKLQIGSKFSDTKISPSQLTDLELSCTIDYKESQADIELIVINPQQELARLKASLERSELKGNIALACHGLNPPAAKNKET